jgi:two-component system, OmpR family, response regulator
LNVRILVIEDDDAIRSILDRGLTAEGFTVETSSNGSSGLSKALDGGFAAVVLDLLLPEMSGYQVCSRLRGEGMLVPILVLTAKSGEMDQIDLLDLGADDFLTKPVSIELISARLRVLLRRGSSAATNVLVRGLLRYDLGARLCTVANVEVVLTNREDQLLQRLVMGNGVCVSRQELLEEVWGTDSGTDPTIVDIYLRKLRTKIFPVEIENVRGIGFRIPKLKAMGRQVDE